MVIGYDAKRAYRNNSGLGNYSRMVIGGVADAGEARCLLYTPSLQGRHEHYFDSRPDVSSRLPQGMWRCAKGLWRSFAIGRAAGRDGVQLFHGLSHELPYGLPATVKKVVTMHDLIVLRYPEFFHPVDRLIHRWKMRHACRLADIVVAISLQTKRDLVEMMHVPEDKIRVVYQSCDPIFWEENTAAQGDFDALKAKYNLPDKYILSVGTVEERKNQATAVRALSLLPDELCLVIVGRPRGSYPQQVRHIAQQCRVGHRVLFLENASFRDFPALYRHAVASVYMSLFEGFGIPVLESLCSDCPVVTSNLSSMPEAGGDAALYAEPRDYRTLAALLSRLLSDPAFRNSQIEKGRTQRLKFAPEKVSQDMLALYRSLLHD